MTVHHIATIVLLYFSWVLNFVRIGSLVLVVHDSADTWLSVSKIKIKLRSCKISENINEKRDGPYRGFGYLSLFKFG